MTQLAPETTGTAPCPCGSGLRADRCCALDWTQVPAEPQAVPDFDRALAAAKSGDMAEAECLVMTVLEQFPRHIGALDLLYQIRRAEQRMGCAEALLARIVRLDPNNILATQTLASLQFA
ncbi:MAG TPA: SEC-C metal-binding domain-containing protein, partial [Steroidobacteraceae bacterium]